jgi:protein-tyrosine phosphatase
MTNVRVLPLEGGCNFRDCGGYETTDGARVRWGRLYRSGVLARLSPAAAAQVQALGVQAVCDLRRTAERALHPNPSFGTAVRRFEWDSEQESSPIRDRAFAESSDVAGVHAAMLAMYRRLPFGLQPRLAGVFAALDHAGQGATIVHCTAGKDRTGVAVALALDSLGVRRDAIVEDYVLTNTAVDLRAQLLGSKGTGAGLAATAEPILALSPTAQHAMLAARPDYIQASLDAIEARHGSVRRYLLDELLIEPAVLERLRQRLLG